MCLLNVVFFDPPRWSPLKWGPKFVHATPPPLKMPFCKWGVYKMGGGYEIPAAGSFKIHPSSPLKMPYGQKRGGGGGVHTFSLDITLLETLVPHP